MPTGVAIRDPRGQLFEAAERILLRDGPAGLTSRSVTAEAGVAKGVLHRHFADFEDFLAELALSRIARITGQADGLLAAAGTGTVEGNLAAALPSLFAPEILALIRLVIARDELRARLRAVTGSRIPLLSESTAMVTGYLCAERDLGRIGPAADIGTLAPTLIGGAHLLFADSGDGRPDPAAIARTVAAVLAGASRLLLGPPFGFAPVVDDRTGLADAMHPGAVAGAAADNGVLPLAHQLDLVVKRTTAPAAATNARQRGGLCHNRKTGAAWKLPGLREWLGGQVEAL
jgi:AcrR family transcriptional regulator